LQRAQSEAQRSFGNSNCLVEKYIDGILPHRPILLFPPNQYTFLLTPIFHPCHDTPAVPLYPAIIETNIAAGKHIEIQIFGDSTGHCISLFERECSIQRRHQKVIEESPSPYMTPQLLKKMSDAATEIGKLLKYEGAGTVEFIVDAKSGGFYFLEVNTRVQVLY
jgi:acetyl/propionyl-CoA carboxylase alpha subunit